MWSRALFSQSPAALQGRSPSLAVVPASAYRQTRFLDVRESRIRARPFKQTAASRWVSQRFPYPLSQLKKIPEKEVERYRLVHRYFPAFTEVELT